MKNRRENGKREWYEKTIVNPYKVDHKMYCRLVVIFCVTLFISLITPLESSEFIQITVDITKNLSYGCIVSAVVAWIIDCTNTKNQNKKSNNIYDAVYADMKWSIANYIGIWEQCCVVVYKEKGYYDKSNTWVEWYRIFKEEYFLLESERRIQVLHFLMEQLTESVQRVRESMDHIQSQRYILTINNVLNSELDGVLSDFHFEFSALDLSLSRLDDSEQFWKSMDAITQDLINYINQWIDIKFYNELHFRPYKFGDDKSELIKAMIVSECI